MVYEILQGNLLGIVGLKRTHYNSVGFTFDPSRLFSLLCITPDVITLVMI